MDFDPRDRDDDARAVEMPWIDVRDADHTADYERDRGDDARERGGRDRAIDPRDPFVDGLELPRGAERELVLDGQHRYELNGDDSRTLATVGAFRVVSERDLREPHNEVGEWRDRALRHLREQGLTESVRLTGRDRAVTLTERGRHLLETHRRDRGDAGQQTFYEGVRRSRELTYREALLAIKDILTDGCPQCVRNTVIWLANDLKWPPTREYQLILVDELLRRSLQRAARVH